MIAQTPTLMEQATIDLLGVFDEEKLASIDLDATIPCDIEPCPDPAVWRLSMRCCGRAWTYCDDCHDSVLRQARYPGKLELRSLPGSVHVRHPTGTGPQVGEALMAAPTDEVRAATYLRDGYRCAVCLSLDLTFQHRRAVGMGGSRILPPPVDGLTLCAICNNACEHDMQSKALAFGWKVQRWADPTRVPVYYPHERAWYRLEGTARVLIAAVVALDAMHAVYGDKYLEWFAQVKP